MFLTYIVWSRHIGSIKLLKTACLGLLITWTLFQQETLDDSEDSTFPKNFCENTHKPKLHTERQGQGCTSKQLGSVKTFTQKLKSILKVRMREKTVLIGLFGWCCTELKAEIKVTQLNPKLAHGPFCEFKCCAYRGRVTTKFHLPLLVFVKLVIKMKAWLVSDL